MTTPNQNVRFVEVGERIPADAFHLIDGREHDISIVHSGQICLNEYTFRTRTPRPDRSLVNESKPRKEGDATMPPNYQGLTIPSEGSTPEAWKTDAYEESDSRTLATMNTDLQFQIMQKDKEIAELMETIKSIEALCWDANLGQPFLKDFLDVIVPICQKALIPKATAALEDKK